MTILKGCLEKTHFTHSSAGPPPKPWVLRVYRPNFIKWNQLDLWIKGRLGKALLYTILPQPFPNFLRLSHVTKCRIAWGKLLRCKSRIYGSNSSTLIKVHPGHKGFHMPVMKEMSAAMHTEICFQPGAWITEKFPCKNPCKSKIIFKPGF